MNTQPFTSTFHTAAAPHASLSARARGSYRSIAVIAALWVVAALRMPVETVSYPYLLTAIVAGHGLGCRIEGQPVGRSALAFYLAGAVLTLWFQR